MRLLSYYINTTVSRTIIKASLTGDTKIIAVAVQSGRAHHSSHYTFFRWPSPITSTTSDPKRYITPSHLMPIKPMCLGRCHFGFRWRAGWHYTCANH